MPYKRLKNRHVEWVGQVQISGRRLYKIFPSKAEAKAWEVEAKSTKMDAMEEMEPQTATPLSLLDWANQYLDYAEKYAPKTFWDKKTAFRRFFKAIDHALPAVELKPINVLNYLQGQFRKRSGHAANKERKNLAAAWSWGAKYLGLPFQNPCLVERFPEKRTPRYVPPERDYWKVYDLSQGQDRTMLLAYLHTAARRGELYRLQWSDVDFGGSTIRLTTRKRVDGSEEAHELPMTDELFTILLEHRQRAVNEWVFTQSVGRHKGKPYTENRGFPQDLCLEAGVKPFGLHAIRHLSASILAKNDVPMVVIQQILRHKKLATTERYVRGLEAVRPHLKVLSGGLGRIPTQVPTQRKKGLEVSF